MKKDTKLIQGKKEMQMQMENWTERYLPSVFRDNISRLVK